METNNLTLEVVAKTSVGMVREANEDNFIVTANCLLKDWVVPQQPYTNSNCGSVLVVADGMGGTNAGEVASKIAIDSVRDYISGIATDKISEGNLKQILVNSIITANKNIVAHGKKNPETEGMGTTIVIAWILESKVHVAWVGDSRCYLFRGGRLTQISKDHSYVQTLVDKGSITKEEAFLHPESNIITQSLGDDSRTPKPDYVYYPLATNDILLLCSDGLNSMLRDATIEAIMSTSVSGLSATADALIQAANDEGGHDNITVLLAKVGGGNAANNEIIVQKQVQHEPDSEQPQIKPSSTKGNPFKIISLLLLLLLLGGTGYVFRKKIFRGIGNDTSLEYKQKLDSIKQSLDYDSTKLHNLESKIGIWENDVKNFKNDLDKLDENFKGVDEELKTLTNYDPNKYKDVKNFIVSISEHFKVDKVTYNKDLLEIKRRIDENKIVFRNNKTKLNFLKSNQTGHLPNPKKDDKKANSTKVVDTVVPTNKDHTRLKKSES